jgi:hypothetical protein
MHLPLLLAQTPTPDEWTSVSAWVVKVGGSAGLVLIGVIWAFRTKLVVIGWAYADAVERLGVSEKRSDERYNALNADWQRRYDALCKDRDGLMERLDRMGQRIEAERQRMQELLLKVHSTTERAVATAAEASRRLPTTPSVSTAPPQSPRQSG